MKISVGADHAGYELKEEIRRRLSALGHEVLDRGASGAESTDYPDYAILVAEDVSQGRAERGILICSTGIGMSITANKVAGVRAALAWNADVARLTREHNDANILAIGARYTTIDQASELTEIFLGAGFLGGRHARRVGKIAAVERRADAIQGDID
ncbi:MAG: putative sugar phosphate isomerase YwlF [Bryobacteraceae bacterium]|nr:putative sugar phosphate isomerase YwlF [Bryobacteraceae bacterium]